MKTIKKLKFDKKIINELTKQEKSSISGGVDLAASKDFDTPTFYDKCFSSGSTTFRDACTWCGFFHITKW
jgi:hypothetical protein